MVICAITDYSVTIFVLYSRKENANTQWTEKLYPHRQWLCTIQLSYTVQLNIAQNNYCTIIDIFHFTIFNFSTAAFLYRHIKVVLVYAVVPAVTDYMLILLTTPTAFVLCLVSHMHFYINSQSVAQQVGARGQSAPQRLLTEKFLLTYLQKVEKWSRKI